MNVHGERLVREVTISDVRALVKSFPGKPHTARLVKAVLGSLYSTMVDEEIVETNPTRGIKVPKVDHTTFAALTPEDFKAIVEHLPSPQLRFFAQFLVGSGLRYGEAAALHVEDFNYDTKEIVVRRRLTEVSKKQSGRDTFAFTQPSTKSGHSRVVPLSPVLAQSLQVLMNSYPNEVIFGADVMFPPQTAPPPRGDWWTPSMADPNAYQHGTRRSYREGQCRCDLCTKAEAYFRHKTSTRKRSVYMERKRWDGVWKAAVKAAGLSWSPRTHDLRHAHAHAHAHATILVASGVDIYEVQRRLGHSSITTTQGYLHRVEAMKSQAPKVLFRGPRLLHDTDPGSPPMAVGTTVMRRSWRLPYRMRPLTAPSQPTWPRPTRRRRTGRSHGRRRALPLTPPTSTPRGPGSHKGRIAAPSSTS